MKHRIHREEMKRFADSVEDIKKQERINRCLHFIL